MAVNWSAGLGAGDNLGNDYGSPNSAAISTWQAAVGRTFKVWRYYFPGLPPTAINADLQLAVSNGIFVALSFKPSVNPPSASDRTTIDSFLSSCKTAGLKAMVTMYHEPFAEGQSVSNYQGMVSFYGPTIRKYFPYHFNGVCGVGTGGSVATYSSFYVSGAFDSAGVDFYCSAYASGIRMEAYAAIGDADGLPFGIWEWGVVEASQTQAQGTAYYNYLTSFFANRLSSGQPVGLLTHFSGTSGAPNTGWPPLAAGDYQTPLFQTLYDTLATAAPSGPYLVGSGSSKPSAASTTLTFTITNSVPIGDAVIVGGMVNDTTVSVSSVTDSGGNAYTAIANAADSTEFGSAMFTCLKTTHLLTGGSSTITVTFSASGIAARNAAVVGYPGGLGSVVQSLDVGSAGSTNPSVTTAGSVPAGGVAVAWETNANAGGNIAWASGWNQQAGGVATGANPISSIATLVPSAAGKVTASGTITSARWDMILVTLQVASGFTASTGVTVTPSRTGAKQANGTVTTGVTVTPSSAGAPSGGAGIAFVQKVANATGTGPLTLTLAVNTTIGNTLVLWGRASSGVFISSVTDSKSNTWHLDVDGRSGAQSCSSIASVQLTTALLISDTITVTFSATQANQEAACAEFSGLLTTAWTDKTAHTHSASGSVSVTTAVNDSQAAELAFTAAAGSDITHTWSITAADASSGGTWTPLDYPSATYGGDAAYQVASTVSLFTAAWSAGAVSNSDACIATYLGTAAAPGPNVVTTGITLTPSLGPITGVVLTPSATGTRKTSGTVTTGVALSNSNTGAVVTIRTFPGQPPNPLGLKIELLLGVTWTDITAFVLQRDGLAVSGMGRADESSSITPSTLNLTLRNDGRFTPKNSSGAYYPNIVRNAQLRVSVNATSSTGVGYSRYRFTGEISSWPPAYDISQRDTYVQVTASGIWRRISAATQDIGSPYARYVRLLTGTSVPAAYWAMEDGSGGSGSVSFVLSEGTGTNIAVTGSPSFAADNTSFLGSNAIPQLNAARLAGNVSAGPTPTSNVIRFALSVPKAGDSTASTFAGGGQLAKILTAGTVAILSVSVTGNQLVFTGSNAAGTQLFGGTAAAKVNGVPVLVSVELTPAGGNIAWALRIIKPGGTAVLSQVTGSYGPASIGAVTQVQLNSQGRFTDTAAGQLAVFYAVPPLVTAAGAAGGWAGEFAVDRFTRLCAESNITATVVGSTSAAMGPQADGTMAATLQSIEDTDGGMLFEPRDVLGLGYRTLGSMQNQSPAVTFAYTAGVLGAPLAGIYDDQLVANQWTVTNWDGYAVLAQLTSGAISVNPPPNGVGSGYSKSKTINASTHAQVTAIAQQLLFQGTVDDVRFPVITVNFLRAKAAPYLASVPGLQFGDYLQITSLPGFLGGGTAKQLIWGYTEHLNATSWTIDFSTIPEAPFETGFTPGVYSVAQVPSGSVAGGASVISGAQIGGGAVGGGALGGEISARTLGGITSFIAAATPYAWSFAVSGTPADATYFTCTEDQAVAVFTGDTFTSSLGLGGPFSVTSLDPPSGGTVNVHFTPDASAVMSSGTVSGGTNGDTWVNTSAGNQVNIWQSGTWVPLAWNAANVIQANSITASLVAAGTIIAGIVNGTTITGVTLIATGTSGEILVYSGPPAAGNLIGSWSGASGSDGLGNSFTQGLEIKQGGLVLDKQPSLPAAVPGSSVFYSTPAGRPGYLSDAGVVGVLERSTISFSTKTCGNTTTPTSISVPLVFKANEGDILSEFEIEIAGTGTGNNQTLIFELYIDGSQVGTGWTMGATMFTYATALTFGFTARFLFGITSLGTSGTIQSSSWGAFKLDGNVVGTSTSRNDYTTSDFVSSSSFNTTIDHTCEIRAHWGGTASGQTVSTQRTKNGRRN